VEEIKEAVRWNIKVSKETDLTLRTYLGAQGMKKGDLLKFIEEAVRWRIFNRTVQEGHQGAQRGRRPRRAPGYH
jgi:ribbon-helix-helix protein